MFLKNSLSLSHTFSVFIFSVIMYMFKDTDLCRQMLKGMVYLSYLMFFNYF